MDFQPAVSIMSVAWLKTEVLRIVTQFYKPNAQMHSGEEQARQDYCRRAVEHYETDFTNASKDAMGKQQQIAIWAY